MLGKIQKKFTQPFLTVVFLWNPLESTADALNNGIAKWVLKKKILFLPLSLFTLRIWQRSIEKKKCL